MKIGLVKKKFRSRSENKFEKSNKVIFYKPETRWSNYGQEET